MVRHQWILDGLAQPGKTRSGLAKALNRQPSMVTELLTGTRELRASEIPIIADYLGIVPPQLVGSAAIVGRIGRQDETVRFAPDGETYGAAPMPPGGTKDAVAIVIDGASVRGIAEDGSLIYYDGLKRAPTKDMLGELCLVGLEDGRVLVKFMHQGRGPGLYDLESAAAPTLRDTPVAWAALVTAIIPRAQARKIIRPPSSESEPVPRKRKK